MKLSRYHSPKIIKSSDLITVYRIFEPYLFTYFAYGFGGSGGGNGVVCPPVSACTVPLFVSGNASAVQAVKLVINNAHAPKNTNFFIFLCVKN